MGLLFDIFFLHTVKVSDLTLKVLVDGFINTHFVQIYWFFMLLFGIYLSIPLYAFYKEIYIPYLFNALLHY